MYTSNNMYADDSEMDRFCFYGFDSLRRIFHGCFCFLAMAYTLHQDGHIRVRILLNKLGKNKKWGERWCYGIGSVLAIYFFYYASRGAHFSYILNDISQQDDAWPMWIPQMVMVIGTLILAIAFIDRFYQSIFFKYEDLEIAWKVKDEKAIDKE